MAQGARTHIGPYQYQTWRREGKEIGQGASYLGPGPPGVADQVCGHTTPQYRALGAIPHLSTAH
eukprot:3030841-Rhodomonas_salina.2